MKTATHPIQLSETRKNITQCTKCTTRKRGKLAQNNKIYLFFMLYLCLCYCMYVLKPKTYDVCTSDTNEPLKIPQNVKL